MGKDDLKRLLRTGLRPDGSVVDRTAMPWHFVAGLTEEELEAMAAYLLAVPAVEKAIPASTPHGGGAVLTIDSDPDRKDPSTD